MNVASLEGLEGLTIGRLADEMQMSKSGLFAHFGSKEELQLAAIEAARLRFVDEVLRPALTAPRGYPRLMAICHGWLNYLVRAVFQEDASSLRRRSSSMAVPDRCTTQSPKR